MIYNHYGDATVIKKHYDGIRAYVEYMRGRYVSGGGLANMFIVYGDWVSPAVMVVCNNSYHQLTSPLYVYLRNRLRHTDKPTAH